MGASISLKVSQCNSSDSKWPKWHWHKMTQITWRDFMRFKMTKNSCLVFFLEYQRSKFSNQSGISHSCLPALSSHFVQCRLWNECCMCGILLSAHALLQIFIFFENLLNCFVSFQLFGTEFLGPNECDFVILELHHCVTKSICHAGPCLKINHSNQHVLLPAACSFHVGTECSVLLLSPRCAGASAGKHGKLLTRIFCHQLPWHPHVACPLTIWRRIINLTGDNPCRDGGARSRAGKDCDWTNQWETGEDCCGWGILDQQIYRGLT